MKISHLMFGAFAGVMLAAGAALAQGAPPDAGAQQAAAPAQPGRPDVKTVGDWFVRCFPVQSPNPCDVYQELDDPRTRQRVLSISLAAVPSINSHIIQITVPLEVSIPKGAVIQTDSYTSPALPYRMCTREGCFVQVRLENDAIEAMSKSGPDAKVKIVADNGKTYDLKFSLKGFAGAHDEMVNEAKAKAKAAPAAPAAP
ncbi:MAG TPA: invasion associated locus B family protein [Rhizomicrobium sp.]